MIQFDMTDEQTEKVDIFYQAKGPCSLCDKPSRPPWGLVFQPYSYDAGWKWGTAKVAKLCPACMAAFAKLFKKLKPAPASKAVEGR